MCPYIHMHNGKNCTFYIPIETETDLNIIGSIRAGLKKLNISNSYLKPFFKSYLQIVISMGILLANFLMKL